MLWMGEKERAIYHSFWTTPLWSKEESRVGMTIRRKPTPRTQKGSIASLDSILVTQKKVVFYPQAVFRCHNLHFVCALLATCKHEPFKQTPCTMLQPFLQQLESALSTTAHIHFFLLCDYHTSCSGPWESGPVRPLLYFLFPTASSLLDSYWNHSSLFLLPNSYCDESLDQLIISVVIPSVSKEVWCIYSTLLLLEKKAYPFVGRYR